MSIGLPSGVLSWFNVTLGVAIGGVGTSFRRQALSVLETSTSTAKPMATEGRGIRLIMVKTVGAGANETMVKDVRFDGNAVVASPAIC
jgi:hypothetical protein